MNRKIPAICYSLQEIAGQFGNHGFIE